MQNILLNIITVIYVIVITIYSEKCHNEKWILLKWYSDDINFLVDGTVKIIWFIRKFVVLLESYTF